jgi:hypothetical protein
MALPKGHGGDAQLETVDLMSDTPAGLDPRYIVPAGYVARPRWVFQELTTGVGGAARVDVFMQIDATIGLSCGAFTDQPDSSLYGFLFSTEVGAGYLGSSASDDKVIVSPLPVAAIQQGGRVKIETFSANFSILAATAQIELFPVDTIGSGGSADLDTVYLLPTNQ